MRRFSKDGAARFVAAGACMAALLGACMPSIETAEQALPRNRTFYATDLTGKGPRRYPVDAALVQEGAHCIVYLDKTDTKTSGVQIGRLVNEFDARIYDSVTAAFGEPYIDSDERRVILLLMDIKDDVESEGGSYVSGYFYPNDLLHSAQSNLLTMLYIDTDPGFGGGLDGVFATVAHELQHLISYSRRIRAGRTALETWIDEGLSTGAECLYLRGQQIGRVRYFSAGGNQIPNGNTFYIWGNRDDLLADYSSAYMFFQWLKIHASNGYHIYQDIAQSEFSDYRAVTAAARSRMPSIVPADLKNEEAWERLLGAWLCANAIGAPNGPYGYGGEITELKVHSPATADVLLAPGEAIYHAPETLLRNSGSLRHVAISAISGEAFFNMEQQAFESYKNAGLLSAILTYNCNTNSRGPNVPFTVAAPLETGPLSESRAALGSRPDGGEAAPAFRPVDVRTYLKDFRW